MTAPNVTPRRRYRGSLRGRLAAFLIAFSMIPILIIETISLTLETNSTRQRLQDTLNAVITLKESQVNQWVYDVQTSLNAEIERDADTRRMTILLRAQPAAAVFQAVYGEQRDIFNSVIASRGLFEEIMLINARGETVLSTNQDQEGKIVASRDFFRQGIKEAILMPPTYDITLGKIALIAAQPITDREYGNIGVIAARINLNAINKIMLERTGMGESGETYLVAKNYILLTEARQPGYLVGETYVRSLAATRAIEFQENNVGQYTNYAETPVLGAYRWLPTLEIALIAEQNQSEAFSSLRTSTNIGITAAILIAIIALLSAYIFSASFTQPLVELTQTAQGLASGAGYDAEPISPVTLSRSDEIGSLASAFASMTQQLAQFIESLEERIAERTRQLQVRSEQLQAASEVGRSVTTILDIEQLLQQVVDLIQQRFDLYYVGLFLADEAGEWAVLKAGTGRAGQAMLGRGHRLKIGASEKSGAKGESQGQLSMTGWAIANGQARIALEAGEDPVRLASAELPDTRSEAAIPLRSRGQVIGALNVQSRLPGAFDTETIAIFQTMADQVAVAIDNARLFTESQKALEAVQQAYGRLSHQAWLERMQRGTLAFRRDESGLRRVSPTAAAESQASFPSIEDMISLPIQVREQTIGQIQIHKRPEEGSHLENEPAASSPILNEQEHNLLNAIIDQLGITLDSARLFEESQQQAERERLVGEITSRMRATLDIDNVLQTAAREMLNALNLAEVEIRLAGGSVAAPAKEQQPPLPTIGENQ